MHVFPLINYNGKGFASTDIHHKHIQKLISDVLQIK